MTEATRKTAGATVDLDAVRREKEAAEARAREEAERLGGPPGGGGAGDEIDGRLIRQCLHANVAGDAELYARLHHGRYLFNAAANLWLRWTGHHWDIDHMRESLAAVEEVASLYDDEAARVQEQIKQTEAEAAKAMLAEVRKTLRARASQLRSRSRRSDCLDFVSTNQRARMAIKGDELDQRPWLLACSNGVIDLITGEMRDGTREDHLLRACPTEWGGIDAPAPLWERFLNEIFEGNQDLVAFVRRAFGMAIVGKVSEHAIIVLSGIGRNGKGTIVGTVCAVMGPLAAPIRSEMLLDQGFVRSSAGPSPDIMALRGLRLAFASETDEHAKISPSRVKWLTGGDDLTARAGYDKFEVTFTPTHTLFLLTNHKPHAPADDFAFWERVHLVPLGLSYVMRDPTAAHERRADRTLPDQLLAEAPGILAWLVRGCIEWQRQGLDPPAIVRAAVAEYRRDEDLIGEFIEECLDPHPDDKIGTPAKDVYDVFAAWWERNISKNAPKQKWFGNLLQRRYRREKIGVYRYFGFTIRPDAMGDDQMELP